MTAKDLKSKARRAAAKAEGMCQKCCTRIAMPEQALCGYCSELAEAYKEVVRKRMEERKPCNFRHPRTGSLCSFRARTASGRCAKHDGKP